MRKLPHAFYKLISTKPSKSSIQAAQTDMRLSFFAQLTFAIAAFQLLHLIYCCKKASSMLASDTEIEDAKIRLILEKNTVVGTDHSFLDDVKF